MQNKVPYEFAIIRLLPKVEREEFINIGAILFCKKKAFLAMRYNLDSMRIKSFSESVEIEMIEEYLKAWQLVCEGKQAGGIIGELDLASRFRWLTNSRSTIIQNSKTHPGICYEPEKELEQIFEKFVL